MGSNSGGALYTTPAFVQSTTYTENVSTFTINKTFGATPTIGNTVIVTAGSYSTTVDCDVASNMTISDNYGNTYTRAVSGLGDHGGGAYVYSNGIWYANVATTGAGFQVTATETACDYVSLGLIEASGIAAVSPVDRTAFEDYDYVSNVTLDGGTTTVPGEFAVTAASSAVNGPFTPAPNWTDLTNAGYLGRAYKTLNATQNITASWTVPADDSITAVMATFKGSVISTTCASPAGVEGDLLYNSTSNKMQYCNGAGWAQIGP